MTIAISAILVFATTGQQAFADNVIGEIDTLEVDKKNATIEEGQTVTVDYWIVATGGSCDPANGSPATVNFGVPAGLSASATSLLFSSCGTANSQPITYTGLAEGGPYDVTVTSVVDASGSYNVNGAKISITVTAPLDTTAPEISYTVNGLYPQAPDGDNGWFTGNADLKWTISEPESPGSLLLTGCVDTLVNYDTAGDTFSCSATSDGGTAGPVEVTIMRDASPPTVSHTLVPTLPDGNNGWYVSDVVLSWQYNDDISNIDASQTVGCLDQTLNTDFDTTTFNCNVTNYAGLSSSDSVDIKRDGSAPILSPAVSGTLGLNGWYVSDVIVSFSPSDPTSSIDAGLTTGCDDTTVNYDTTGVSFNCHAVNNAGLYTDASLGPIMRDVTDPYNVAFTDGSIADGGSYYFGFLPAGPTACDADDDTSGFDHCDVTGGGSSVGSHSYTATAYDGAGNSATATLSYTVLAWTINGFYQPIDMNGVENVAKAGKVIPVKYSLYAGVTELTSTDTFYSLKWIGTNTCSKAPSTDAIEEYVDTGSTDLRYDPIAHQFIRNIKVPAIGCYNLVLTTDDGSFISALFAVTK